VQYAEGFLVTGLPNGNLSTGSQPLVSVVMNCYNSSQYLREAIDSVLAQTYQNWEIIFWDNRSTDASAEIFNSYSDSRLHYFLAPEYSKLGKARNLAVGQARGDWLCFLDCDDIWFPEKLERQVAIIASEGPDLGFVYGQMLVLHDGEEPSSKWSARLRKYSKKTLLNKLPEGLILEKLLMINFVPLLTAIVSREFYHEVGGISEHFEQAEDYELFVKIAAIKKVRAVQSVVALYRVHQSNNSIINNEKGFYEALELIGRYLPAPAAIRGIRFRHATFAITQIESGKLWSGICHIATCARLSALLLWRTLKI
jgi:glycosyltransferase involved in cell wall biosynthesis